MVQWFVRSFGTDRNTIKQLDTVTDILLFLYKDNSLPIKIIEFLSYNF